MTSAEHATNVAVVRAVRDRMMRAQRTYAARLREAIESLQPLIDEGHPEACDVASAARSELAHISYGSAITEE